MNPRTRGRYLRGDAARLLAPPVLLSAARRLRARGPAEWQYLGTDWPSADVESGTWDDESVAVAYERRWPALTEALRGTRPLGISLEVPDAWGREIATDELGAHNLLMSYAAVLARASGGTQRMTLLDWGGGPGHYYLIAKALLPRLELDYCCKETPSVCDRARKLLGSVEFVSDDSCLERKYDLVMASSSVHYARDWQALVRRLASAAAPYLYIARVPFIRTGSGFTVLQRAHEYGYYTSYIGWVLNRDDLISCATAAGMTLVREFLSVPEVPIAHAETGGFLFAGGG